MKALGNNWKAIVAVLLLIAALLVFLLVYRPAKASYEQETASLNTQIQMAQTQIETNQRIINENIIYEDIQDELPEAREELTESREDLYEHFPAEFRPEDQIMYVLYLEQLFGNRIQFKFGWDDQEVMLNAKQLSDGSVLKWTKLVVNYEAPYEAFQELVDYLATDDQLTSVQYCTMNYDENTDTVSGEIALLRYLLVPSDYDASTYTEPDVETSGDEGKDNIFVIDDLRKGQETGAETGNNTNTNTNTTTRNYSAYADSTAGSGSYEGGADGAGQRPEQVMVPDSSIKDTDTVYTTNYGHKYHVDGCEHLYNSKIPTTKAAAIANGDEPCEDCIISG